MKLEYTDNAMFSELLEAIDKQHVAILAQNETDKVFDLFQANVPIYQGGSRIDWSKINKTVYVDSPHDIRLTLDALLGGKLDETVYVFWNDASLPVIRTDLTSIIKNYDCAERVGFETWIYNPKQGYIIENYYLGEINLGLVKPSKLVLS